MALAGIIVGAASIVLAVLLFIGFVVLVAALGTASSSIGSTPA